MDQNKNAAPQREAAMKSILAKMPGNDSASQRARLLAAMQTLGHVTSYEGSRLLDCYDPRARIHELRNKHGHTITTVMRDEETESGVRHRVGVYFLSQAKEGST
ncbi:helix-turn-helix domain-containing protein [Paraburkholderia sp. FT54]|uniref:helix-turn-helix domain-containing protein n=1 Tax=Paraburkholderia sp. FT54 TaxID=3074437 RepID=UPI00287750C7|nr:helix-turn-helix domain-containing protein [Paraburkholderia sp. FT54]WNC90514.1 helix-turn-helix domain-containing protein [Paraburkholderia sp. FT54]